MTSYRRKQLVIALSIVAIVGVMAWWYWSGTFEDKLVYRPANSKLNTENFHVARRWLEHQGYLTHDLYQLDDLNLFHHERRPTLFLSTPPGFHNDLEAHRLHEWIERGGHIVLPAPSVIRLRTRAPDLNPHGLTACQGCLEPEDKDAEDPEWWRDFEPRHLISDPRDRSYNIWTRHGIELPDQETRGLEIWTNPDGQPMVVRYGLGQGQITMLASWRWLGNQRLVYPEHVRLLEALIDDPEEYVYFQQRTGSGGLLSWLWQQAPLLWIVALVLLGLWAWSRWPRLGPLRDAGLGADTRMEKHLLATARFDWQRHGAANLLEAMHEERQLRLRKRFPDWHRLDRNERTERLCALLPQLDARDVDDLLDTRRERHSQSFIRLVRLHEQLMKVL